MRTLNVAFALATFVIRPGGDVVGIAAGPREWNRPEMRALVAPLLPAAR